MLILYALSEKLSRCFFNGKQNRSRRCSKTASLKSSAYAATVTGAAGGSVHAAAQTAATAAMTATAGGLVPCADNGLPQEFIFSIQPGNLAVLGRIVLVGAALQGVAEADCAHKQQGAA